MADDTFKKWLRPVMQSMADSGLSSDEMENILNSKPVKDFYFGGILAIGAVSIKNIFEHPTAAALYASYEDQLPQMFKNQRGELYAAFMKHCLSHRQNYREELTQEKQIEFDSLLPDSFVSSKALWGNLGLAPGGWQKGSLHNGWCPREPDCWTDPGGLYLTDDAAFPIASGNNDPGPTVKTVIDILRNALAHGDVVYASNGSDEQNISRIVFVASKGHPAKKNGHEFIATTPDGLRALIDAWRDVLPKFGYQALNPEALRARRR